MNQLVNAIKSAACLNETLTGTHVSEEFESQLNIWGAGIFRLVVMGEIKKGKSSFINALLGKENLVPVASDVATSTVFKIRYSKTPFYRVHFMKDSGRDPLDISESEVSTYGTENGNPKNARQVDFIEVGYTSPVLKSGLVIIDTPGLGGLFKGHKKITWQYVPKSDAVIFVTDSVESPIGAAELEYLEEVRKITPYIFFIQTKIAEKDEDDCEARRKNNLNILSGALGVPAEKIPYFLVDSKAKHQADITKDEEELEFSGFISLMAFMQKKLFQRQHAILSSNMLQLATPMLQSIAETLRSRREILLADTTECREKTRKSVEEKQKELQQWQTEKQPLLLETINDGLKKIQRECEDDFSKLCVQGEVHTMLNQMVESAENMKKLDACVTELESKISEYYSAVILESSNMLQYKTQMLMQFVVESFEQMEKSEICNNEIVPHSDGALFIIKKQDMPKVKQKLTASRAFETGRNVVYGGLAGVTICAVVGGVIGSVVPVIGTVIGSEVGLCIAAIWGMKSSLDNKRQGELHQAKQQVLAAVAKAVSLNYLEGQKYIRRQIEDVQKLVYKTIKDALKQLSDDYSKQIQELKVRGSMNLQEIDKKKQELLVMEKQWSAIQNKLSPWLKSDK